MSNQHVEGVTRTEAREDGNVTSRGNGTVLSVVLFIVLFGLFAGGLYVMALFTAVTFLVGLGMCMLALYGTFDLVPRFLSK